jgi:hypothetical protein
MQVETCQVGRALRLGDNTRMVIHRRQGERVCLGATAPAGTDLILGGALVRPIASPPGTWTYLFSLQALRGFTFGRFEVRIWLPGELIPLAADCEDWLHIGISPVPEPPLALAPHHSGYARSLPAPVPPARPLLQVVEGGGRFLFGRP